MSEGNSYYVVRGAKMQCEFGSHKRQINLPVSHGSYVNKKPMINEGDKVPLKNISYFGICSCPSNPSNQIVNLVSETGATITGRLCCPIIIGNWTKTKGNTKVEGKAALTTDSQLFCSYKGKITFTTNGQENK